MHQGILRVPAIVCPSRKNGRAKKQRAAVSGASSGSRTGFCANKAEIP
jgi:hypothetical protein